MVSLVGEKVISHNLTDITPINYNSDYSMVAEILNKLLNTLGGSVSIAKEMDEQGFSIYIKPEAELATYIIKYVKDYTFIHRKSLSTYCTHESLSTQSMFKFINEFTQRKVVV